MDFDSDLIIRDGDPAKFDEDTCVAGCVAHPDEKRGTGPVAEYTAKGGYDV